MVGSAVDKGLRSRELVPMTWNETIIEGNETTQVVLDNSAEILDVKLKYAMAVTFAVGVLQVTAAGTGLTSIVHTVFPL